MRLLWRWTRVGSLALALWVGGVASAAPDRDAVGVTLPKGEEPTTWRAMLEAAGLELALPPRTAQVRIESLAERWRVVALEGGAVARELFVPAPTTDLERQEIAVLARALTMHLEPPEPPGTEPRMVPPPPPPLRLRFTTPSPPESEPGSPADREDVVEPEPIPEAEPVDEPEPELAAEVVEAAEPVATGEPDSARTGFPYNWRWPFRRTPRGQGDDDPGRAEVTLSQSERRERRQRRRRSLEAPPTALLLGVSLRDETQVAGVVGLQTDAATAGPLLLTSEFAVQPARWLNELPDEADERSFFRQLVDVRGLMGLGLEVVPELRVGVVGGAAYRTYRQQGRPVLTTFVPLGGAQAELVAGGRFRVGVRGQVLTDLTSTDLVDSTGVPRTLAPVDVSAQLLFRVQPRQRKSARRASRDLPKARSLEPIDLDSLPEQ